MDLEGFLWVYSVFMVFDVELWWESIEFLKNVTVFITQVTKVTIYIMVNTIQNQ